MSDFREFRKRPTEIVWATLLTRDNAYEVRERAFASDVKLIYHGDGTKPHALRYLDCIASNTRKGQVIRQATFGEMAVVLAGGVLTMMSEIEFLRTYEPHGHIDWTEPRLQRETLAKHAVEILGRLGAPTDNGALNAWVANVLSDVRATGSEANAIREGYIFSTRNAEQRADELQDIVNDWRERVRMIKRATVKSPDHMDGDEARAVLREVRKWTRHLKVGRF